MGKFGNFSESSHTVWKCVNCQIGILPTASIDYESDEYRKIVDGNASVDKYHALHDGEQAEKLRILGTSALRGKVIAEIGCGAGSFLDLVKGYAKETIAIEPAVSFHKQLKSQGHHVFSYTDDALEKWVGSVDVCLSFAVIEHTIDPLLFVLGIAKLLKAEGSLLVSTPNYDDWLLDFLPEDYGRFFYRRVHKWYFNEDSLKHLGARAGFKKRPVITHMQRFDFSNAIHWLRDRVPTGIGATTLFQGMDNSYQEFLRNKGRTDFIYANFRK